MTLISRDGYTPVTEDHTFTPTGGQFGPDDAPPFERFFGLGDPGDPAVLADFDIGGSVTVWIPFEGDVELFTARAFGGIDATFGVNILADLDPGSIDATLPYTLSYAVPDLPELNPGESEIVDLLFDNGFDPTEGGFETTFPSIVFQLDLVAELDVLLALELGVFGDNDIYTILDFAAGTTVPLISLDTARKDENNDADPLNILGVTTQELIDDIEGVEAAYDYNDEFAGVKIPFAQFLSSDKSKEKPKAKTDTKRGDTKADEQEDPPDPSGLDVGSLEFLIPNINTVSTYDDDMALFVTDPSRRLLSDGTVETVDNANNPLNQGNRADMAALTLDLDGILTYATGFTFPPLEYKFPSFDASLGPLDLSAEFGYNLVDVELRAALPLEQEFTLTPALETRLKFFEKNADGSKGDAKEVAVAQVVREIVFVESASFRSEAVEARLRAIAEESAVAAQDVALFVDYDAGIPAAFTGGTGSIAGRIVVREVGEANWTPLGGGDVIARSAPALGEEQTAPIDLSGKEFAYWIARDDTAADDDEFIPITLDGEAEVFRRDIAEVISGLTETPFLDDLSAIAIDYAGGETFVEVEHRAAPVVTNRTGLEFDLSLLLQGLALEAGLGVSVDFGPFSIGAELPIELGPLFKQRFPLFNADLIDFFNDAFTLLDEESNHVTSFVLGEAGAEATYSADAILGTDDPETLPGTDGDDTIVALAGADDVAAGDGEDLVQGGAGDDTLRGEAGDDTLVGGTGADLLLGGAGFDRADFSDLPAVGVAPRRGVEVIASNFGTTEDLVRVRQATEGDAPPSEDTLRAIEELVLTEFADELTLQVFDMELSEDMLALRRIDGGGGDDALDAVFFKPWQGGPLTLLGGKGADTIFFSYEDDDDLSDWLIDGGAGVDLLQIADARFDLSSGAGRNGIRIEGIENVEALAGFGDHEIIGDDGDNRLTGHDGDDTLIGGAGDDTLIASDGGRTAEERNLLVGGIGADSLVGNGVRDVASYAGAATSVFIDMTRDANGNGQGFRGEAQGDVLAGIEDVIGSDFDDILIGDEGINLLEGGDGNDRIMGARKGNQVYVADTLSGGDGDDLLTRTTDDPARVVTSSRYATEYRGGDGFDVIAVDVWDPFVQTGTTTGRATFSYRNDDSTTSNVTIDYKYERSAGVTVVLDEDGGGDVVYVEDNPENRIFATGISGTATYSHNEKRSFIDLFPPWQTATSRYDYNFSDQTFQQLLGDSVSFTRNSSLANNNGTGTITSAPEPDPSWGEFGRESFTGIEGVIGSRGNDRLTGNDEDNALFGNGGADDIRGGGGDDRLGFGEAQELTDVFSFPGGYTTSFQFQNFGDINRGTPLASILAARDPNAATEEEAGKVVPLVENIYISFGGSRIVEQVGSFLWGQAGSDTLDMRFDRGISFFPDRSDSHAVVDLNVAAEDAPTNAFTGEAVMYGQARWIAADGTEMALATTFGIENVIGSNSGDILRGDRGDNVIEGLGGADQAWGEDGIDTFSYALSDHGVEARFQSSGGPTVEMRNEDVAAGTDATGDVALGFERFVGSPLDDVFTLSGPVTAAFESFEGARDGFGAERIDIASAEAVTFEMGDGDDLFSTTDFRAQIVRLGDGADTARIAGGNIALALGAGDDRVEVEGTDAMAPEDESARTVEIEGGDGLDTIAFDAPLRSLTVQEDGIRIEVDQAFEVFDTVSFDSDGETRIGRGDPAPAETRDAARADAPPLIYELSGVEVLEVEGRTFRLDSEDPILGPDRTFTLAEDAIDPFALDVTPPEDEAGQTYRVTELPLGAAIGLPGEPDLEPGDTFTHAELAALEVRPNQEFGTAADRFVYVRADGEGTERVAALPVEAPLPGVAMRIEAPVDPLGGALGILVTDIPTEGVVVAMRAVPELLEMGLVALRPTPLSVGDALTPDEVAGLRYVAGEDATGPAGAFAFAAATAAGLRDLPGAGTPQGDPDLIAARDGVARQRIAIEVTPVDDAPEVARVLFPISPGGEVVASLVATDAEEDAFTLELMAQASLGDVSVQADGSIVYRQNEAISFEGAAFVEDTFKVRASQERGGLVSEQVQTIRIVNPDALEAIVFDPDDPDVYFDEEGNPVALGGLGTDDLIIGHDGADELHGFGGKDRLEGRDGNDLLIGGRGDDDLRGGRGRDTMEGGEGDDTYLVDDVRDVIVETAGFDTVRIDKRMTFQVTGTGVERVELLESAGASRIFGDGGATEMVGNSRVNVLVSGGGADEMTGGGGADYFAFQRGSVLPDAVVMDFDRADKLALDDRFFGMGNGSVDPRELTPDQVLELLDSGRAGYSLRRKELSVDFDGPDGPGGLEVIATFEGRPALGLDDVVLF